MNTEEIEKIAKEYAEHYIDNRPCYMVDNIVKKEVIKRDVADFIEWLSVWYCIAEKEVVLKEYESTYPDDIDRDLVSFSRERLLRELFGDQLFNEKK